ncbi:hypothetical protein [Streptomyces sp. NPDC056683]|uniref:hypothetical protein n=1 Tax=Streptomyces sp. NPDC056683 TaxID=3345910 RepID=UPI0036B06749
MNALTCCDERLMVTDLRELPFGYFTLVALDGAGSPRKVPFCGPQRVLHGLGTSYW